MSRSFRTDPISIRAARRTSAAKTNLRVVVQPPRQGYYHPATAGDVRKFIHNLGPIASYGLKQVTLSRLPEALSGRLRFGRYEPPNRITLYEQPIGEWVIQGALDPALRLVFENFGAHVMANDAVATIVSWRAESLRNFMLQNILMHEIGHHVLQYHSGKRPAWIVRSRDHEAFAQLFIRRRARMIRAHG